LSIGFIYLFLIHAFLSCTQCEYSAACNLMANDKTLALYSNVWGHYPLHAMLELIKVVGMFNYVSVPCHGGHA